MEQNRTDFPDAKQSTLLRKLLLDQTKKIHSKHTELINSSARELQGSKNFILFLARSTNN